MALAGPQAAYSSEISHLNGLPTLFLSFRVNCLRPNSKTEVEETGEMPVEELIEYIHEKASKYLIKDNIDSGDAVVYLVPESAAEFFALLKEDPDLRFDMLSSITAVDWMDRRPERFELVYHIYSITKGIRLRAKLAVSEVKPEVESVTHIWSSADFLEREVWDMYGIRFRNHPNLKRILMYEEFVGHPLRKDYPLRGKQPRVPLIAPEARNTSLDMKRPALEPKRRREGEQ